jgi:hypothetical protein
MCVGVARQSSRESISSSIVLDGASSGRSWAHGPAYVFHHCRIHSALVLRNVIYTLVILYLEALLAHPL